MAKQGSMIRDLIINVKASDLAPTTKEAQKLVDALVDTATSAELIKSELNGVNTTFKAITRNASSAAKVFADFSLNDKFKASLNSILEGINRIKASAKDLKGLDIGISVRVDNLTKLQNDIAKSVQGLDVGINLKSGNIKATKDRLDEIVNSLEDAAAGVELFNTELKQASTYVKVIQQDASEAAITLTKLAVSKNLENGLEDVLHVLNNISEEIVQLNLDSRESFRSMEKSIDRVDDSLGEMSKTLHSTRIATKGVSSNTKELIESFNNSSKATKSMAESVGQAFSGVRNGSRIMGDLAKLAGPIPAAFAIISAHVWALTAAFEQLSKGDSLNRLEQIGTTIGANVGVPVQKVAAVMVDATNGAISYESALRKAANASAYGFSTKELEQMTEVARRAAVVMGVEMDDALNRIIRGVSKQEIELLDELGITIRLTEAQNAYAKSIGTTADKLSSNQKQQAYLNAVLAQSEKSFGFLSDSDLGATNIEKLGAKFDELTNKVRQSIAALSNEVLERFFSSKSDEATTSISAVLASQSAITDSLLKAAKNYDPKGIINLLNEEADSGTVELEKARIKILELTKTYDRLKKAGEDDFFAAREANQIYADLKSQVEAYTAAKEAHNKILASGAKLLALDNLELSQQQKIFSSLSDIMKEYKSASTSTSRATENFGAALYNSGKYTSILTDEFEKYEKSLQDIDALYTKIDKFESIFPDVPKPLIERMKLYADEVARAAGGFKNRQEFSQAFDAATNLTTFEKKNQFAENEFAAIENSRTGLTGDSQVLIEQKKLAIETERLKLAQEVLRTSKTDKQAQATVMQAKKNILEIEGRLADANATRLSSMQAISAAEVRMYEARLNASPLSVANSTVLSLKAELELLKQNREELVQQGIHTEVLSNLDADILEKQFAINKAIKDASLYQLEYQRSIAEVNNASAEFEAYMSGITVETVNARRAQDDLVLAMQRLAELEKSIANKDSGTKQEEVVAAKLAVEQAKLAKKKAEEEQVHAIAQQDSNKFELQSIQNNLGELDIAKGKAELEQQHLENLRNIKASQTAINAQVLATAEAEKQVNDIINQRHRDLVDGSIGAIQGENQMQYTSTAGMDKESAKLTQQNDGLANIANSFDQLAQYDQPFANVAANLSQMAIAIQDNASAMQIASIAGQAITSMFQMNGQAAIDSIDAQIAAEEKRDGKSAQSLAKIRALEAKKIETTRKTARQTIIMQTAVGVANALAMGNPLIGIPMAIAVAAMGMQALKAADSSAESSLAGLDSAEATGSLTLGDRTNKVDTAQTANSGELSYIQGVDGVGGIQNFTPRASGGPAYAGHSYIVGEKGPELWTPKVDSTVSDAQSTRSGSSGAANVTLNIQALDARSFADLVYTDPQLFQNVVEMSLNQQGKTLG